MDKYFQIEQYKQANLTEFFKNVYFFPLDFSVSHRAFQWFIP